jgi:hypothetical protein
LTDAGEAKAADGGMPQRRAATKATLSCFIAAAATEAYLAAYVVSQSSLAEPDLGLLTFLTVLNLAALLLFAPGHYFALRQFRTYGYRRILALTTGIMAMIFVFLVAFPYGVVFFRDYLVMLPAAYLYAGVICLFVFRERHRDSRRR